MRPTLYVYSSHPKPVEELNSEPPRTNLAMKIFGSEASSVLQDLGLIEAPLARG